MNGQEPAHEQEELDHKPEASDDFIRSLDAESRLLEELFAKRFNYYSLFFAAFVVLIFQPHVTNVLLIRIGLIAGLLIFGLMFLSIWRTNILINRILDQLARYESYPLTVIMNESQPIRFPPFRSNTYILLISLILFLLIGVLTVLALGWPEVLLDGGT